MLKTVIKPDSIELKREKTDLFFFSRTELKYLKGEKTVNSNYERVLLHRIYKKLDCFRDEILPILAKNNRTRLYVETITENSNAITKFSNSKLSSNQVSFENYKCGRRDLNPGYQLGKLKS